MASQPPAGNGLLPAPSADPDRGPRPPLGPTSTSRAKRRRDTKAQPARLGLTGSQLDAPDLAPLTDKGASSDRGIATGSILAALNEEARQFEARKDVFLTIA